MIKRKILIALFLAALAAGAWATAFWVGSEATADKVLTTSFWIVGLFVTFSLVLEEIFASRLRDTKMRYTLRKIISLLLIAGIALVVLRIWIPNPQALLVAYGLITAGIAIALQDLVKNLAGTLIIFFGGVYEVGNRVEIQGVQGDVIDIGVFNTTLLEIGNWINADQSTGRIATVPNGAVLKEPVQNFTRQHEFLWDEIEVTVTSESDWKKAIQILEEVGGKHTEHFLDTAKQSLTNLEKFYYVEGHILKPNVYVKATDFGYTLTLRYVVNAWERRSTLSNIWRDVITAFEVDAAIALAPPMTVIHTKK